LASFFAAFSSSAAFTFSACGGARFRAVQPIDWPR
jgi:hypothetical protein